MPTIELKKYKCLRCGKDYEDSVRGNFPGKPCKQCTQLMMNLNEMTRKLLAQFSSLGAEDAVIAQKIKEFLEQENRTIILTKGNKDLLNALIGKLTKDDDRRKQLIEEIRKLQKAKK